MPQSALKIDNSTEIYDNEILIEVSKLNIDAASFKQIENDTDGSEDAERKQLASMNNSYFYEYVQEMMPSCMKDLAKMKV